MQNELEQNKITIGDIAEALGISKTTVSRAISGKGRIGEATRQKVMDYIKETDYKPSPLAKGLAQSKTYNIGWVMPGDSTMTDLPFFQRCMIGIGEIATGEDYDILISLVYEDDFSQLRRIVENKKVDGIILGRTLLKDDRVAYLMEKHFPFVVIGSSPAKNVIQIDNDHVQACKELTSILVMKGLRDIVLIGGSSNHVVNQTRRKGFELGITEQGLRVKDTKIYMDNEKPLEVERALDDALRNGAKCIICMDDRICDTVLSKLRRDNIRIPQDIKVASFYNSTLLENHQPAITALQYDPKELGSVACRTLLDYLNGIDVKEKVLLNYEVILKSSTQ